MAPRDNGPNHSTSSDTAPIDAAPKGAAPDDGAPDDAVLAAWFLDPLERGNPFTALDRRGVAWTVGNRATVLIDGAAYFRRLRDALCATGPGDTVMFTDWQGDADEQLDGRPGSEIATILRQIASRGVAVRGLLWRSHPSALSFAEGANLDLAKAVNEEGGEVLLDQRVRHGGSHHQKIVVVRGDDPDADVAFVGGIDISHGRRDDARHQGDPQSIRLNPEHYGERPPWHDVQLEVSGPAVGDIECTFRERWNDDSPLDTRSPWRVLLHRFARTPRQPSALPGAADRSESGTVAVQVLRTYPARRHGYPFAPEGERSIARAYLKTFGRARRLIFLEDQYLWSFDAARNITTALRREPELVVAIVIPRYPDPDGRVVGGASRIGREYVMRALTAAAPDRVAVFDLENTEGTSIYVHSKVCVVDDVWLAVGSDNLNRRSWTHDSEISCALVDSTLDTRAPVDPAGRGDGARVLARDTRLRLTREHLGRGAADDHDLVDPREWFNAMRASAAALDAWHAGGRRGVRPPGHLRLHPADRVRGWRRIGQRTAHRLLLDPDGRPRALRRADAM